MLRYVVFTSALLVVVLAFLPESRLALSQGAQTLLSDHAPKATLASPVRMTLAEKQAMAARPTRPSSRKVKLQAARNGHFYANVKINGSYIPVLVDTGASVVGLRGEDAAKLGIRPRRSAYKVPVSTANGIIHCADVTLKKVRLKTIQVRNVRGLVCPKGVQQITLLGMSFLSKLDNYSVRKGQLTLEN